MINSGLWGKAACITVLTSLDKNAVQHYVKPSLRFTCWTGVGAGATSRAITVFSTQSVLSLMERLPLTGKQSVLEGSTKKHPFLNSLFRGGGAGREASKRDTAISTPSDQ